MADNVRNASLIAEICREEVPKLCSRSLISKETRPCSNHGTKHKFVSLQQAENPPIHQTNFRRELPVHRRRPDHRVHSKSERHNAHLRARFGVQNPLRVCGHLAGRRTAGTVSGGRWQRPEGDAGTGCTAAAAVAVVRPGVQVRWR